MSRYIVEKIVEDLYILRLNDNDVRYFEALWYIPEGITYNAYLLLSRDEVLLFDGWKHRYADMLIEAITGIIDPKDITRIVVHHVEPDHSGSIPRILEVCNGSVEILCHPFAVKLLQSLYTVSFKFKVVKDGEELSIGDKTLKFLYTPWLHWPETFATYILEDGILMSCDAFGGFSIPKGIFDDDVNMTGYLPYVRKYIIDIIGQNSDYIIKALDKLRNMNISPKIIAPAHGLVFRKNPEIIVNYYERIAKCLPEENKITIIYDSMYGSVEKAIVHTIKKLKELGIKYVIFKFTDLQHSNIGEILSEIADCKALIIGVSTYENDLFPCIDYLLDLMVKKVRIGKPILLISSYGWSKIVSIKLREKLSETSFEIFESIEFQGQPSFTDLQKIDESIGRLINSIK